MSDVPSRLQDGLTTHGKQPLIGIPVAEGPDDLVRYFASEEAADQALASEYSGGQRALGAIGAWSDLDFDDMQDQLDHIRHQSRPTPPIDPDGDGIGDKPDSSS